MCWVRYADAGTDEEEHSWQQLLAIVALREDIIITSLRRMGVAVERCSPFLQDSDRRSQQTRGKMLAEQKCDGLLPNLRVVFLHPSLHNTRRGKDSWTMYRPRNQSISLDED